MLASITIETQPPDGSSPTWFVLAQWAGGTVLLVLVILLVVGVVQFVKGKATANSEAARKGLTTAALSLGGAVVIGTSAAAIAWSAQGSNYNILGAGGDGAGSQGIANLMPAGARPAEVEVSRAGPLVSCEGPVAIAAERHSSTFGSIHPTVREHQIMEAMLEDNDVLDQLKDSMEEGGNMGTGAIIIDTDDMDALWGREDAPSFRISRVEWIPSDASGGCEASNREAVPETTIEVTVWYGNGENWMADQVVDEYNVTAP